MCVYGETKWLSVQVIKQLWKCKIWPTEGDISYLTTQVWYKMRVPKYYVENKTLFETRKQSIIIL